MNYTCILENIELHTCDDYNHYKEYEDSLFALYCELYESNDMTYNGMPVKMKHFPPEYGERSGFYHLAYQNYKGSGNEADRLPNIDRAKLIDWPRLILDNCNDDCEHYLVWENVRHGKKNTLIFCIDFDYLIVLSHRNNYYLLTTAYPVDHENRRNDLLDEYEKYQKTNNASSLH